MPEAQAEPSPVIEIEEPEETSSATETRSDSFGVKVPDRALAETGATSGASPFAEGSELAPSASSRPDSSPAMEETAPRKTPLEAVGSGVLEEIERFNRRHRELYSVLKGAVGAGAKNFVSTCIRRLGADGPDFSGLTPDETGAFSAEMLYERVGAQSPARIRVRLESLIEAEAETASLFLDPKTLERLHKRLETATWDLAEHS
jgi:hypothetical protein